MRIKEDAQSVRLSDSLYVATPLTRQLRLRETIVNCVFAVEQGANDVSLE